MTTQPMTSADELRASIGLHDRMAQAHPSLRRGKVWCAVCGVSREVSSAHALRCGWPNHCGHTMTIDSPAERRALANEKDRA